MRRCLLPAAGVLPALLIPAFILGMILPRASAQPPATVGSKAPVRIDDWVLEHTAHGEAAEVIVLLREQADLAPAAALPTKLAKGRFVFETLLRTAQRTQGPLLALLEERGAPHRAYYIANAVWARVDRPLVEEIARRPEVAAIEGNPLAPGLEDRGRSGGSSFPAFAVEPGIASTNAPAVWALGFTGQGIVIGGQDTGYQWNHPALIQQYRGWNGTTASHDYNWHDSIHSGGGSCGANVFAPCDDSDHGTHTMGTALGSDGGANLIGMAPGARWIGVRTMDQGSGSPAAYMESFQFSLAPYPFAGTPAQGNPAMAPDLTTNSWLCSPTTGCTSTSSLLLSVQAHRAAGIMTIVAAGNTGSACSSVFKEPGIFDEVTSVGALTNGTNNAASFSSRGPVTIDGSNRRKPDIVAPGTSIRSSVRGSTYAGGWSGTSMATPHVAGAVALLWSAHPALKNDIAATERVLQDSAFHISSSSCSSSGWPNNVFGYGRLDVLAAVQAVHSETLAPATSNLSGAVGATGTHQLTLTNTGYVAAVYTVAVTGGTWAASATPNPVGPVNPGSSAIVSIQVQVPAGATIGTSSSSTVTVAVQAWPSATAQAQVVTTAAALVPTLAVTQPGGPAAALFVNDANLAAGHEYYNVFSGDLCASAGAGPYLGLCAADPAALLAQFLLPLGTEPFRFQASGTSQVFGPYALPPGLTLDGVCFDFTGGILGGVSRVVRFTVQ